MYFSQTLTVDISPAYRGAFDPSLSEISCPICFGDEFSVELHENVKIEINKINIDFFIIEFLVFILEDWQNIQDIVWLPLLFLH